MELVSHEIALRKRDQEVLLMPIGDIQWSGRDYEVAIDMLKRHVKWGVERGAYFIGMGDYIDFMSPSNRAKFESAALYDTAMKTVDDKAHSLVEDIFLQALKPSKGRWLGLLEGHHFHKYRDGTTSDQELARMLDTPFLGSAAFVRLVLQRKSSTKTSSNNKGRVVIWCHHGVGGGLKMSAPLNKIENIVHSFDADIYLMGHHHKKVAAPLDQLVPMWGNTGAKLSHRTKIIACTGGFLRGYIEEHKEGEVPRGNYVEQKMLGPVSLGGILVKIRARWNTAEGWSPDMSVEM